MNQSNTVEQLRDMVTLGHDIEDALKMAYAIGFDEGREFSSFSKPVIQMDLDGRPLSIHPSRQTAEKVSGVDPASISRAANGLRKKAGGYKWRYLE